MKCFVRVEASGRDREGKAILQRFSFGFEDEGGNVSVSRSGKRYKLKFGCVEVVVDNETARHLLDLLSCLEEG